MADFEFRCETTSGYILGDRKHGLRLRSSAGYSDDLAKNFIAAIRTDLDSFSEAEASVLENHGYWLADAAIQKHVPALLPANIPPLKVPHPAWAGPEDKLKEALKDSRKRTLLGHASRAAK